MIAGASPKRQAPRPSIGIAPGTLKTHEVTSLAATPLTLIQEATKQVAHAHDHLGARFNTASALDPRWVQHHFQWTRGTKGGDVLSERPDFVVLPYRGDLEPGKPGEYQGYTLRPGG